MRKRSPIYHSVGASGTNLASDVCTVQRLLNASGVAAISPLIVDGRAGPATIFAIEKVQRRFLHMKQPDGRVDPDGETLRFLTAGHAHVTDSHVSSAPSFTSYFSQTLTSAYHSLQAEASAFGSSLAQTMQTHTVAPPSTKEIAWGAKVSSSSKAKVIKICEGLSLNPDFLMSCMAFESGETFSPSIKNPHSSATGLIQFMAATAKGLGTTTDALSKLTAEAQLDYVEKYFQPYAGRLKTIEDTYMVILYPAAVGKDNSFVLFSSPSKMYEVNKGLDTDGDNKITKSEAGAAVAAKLKKGLKAGFKG
jgi:hypothetical protein